jgi:acetyl esterase/lipase
VTGVIEPFVPWLFLFVALVGAWFTVNAYRPIHRPAPLALASFFAGWLTTELAFHHLAWQALATALFVWAGALATWPGWLALGITFVSWLGLSRCYGRALGAEAAVEHGLAAALGADYTEHIRPDVRERLAPGIDWKQIALPFPMRHPEVERIRDLEYHRVNGRALRLDVYRHRDRPTGCPTLLQIHGGGWVVGSKNEQGVPLMLHLASRGWVCVSADYRLAPFATFPEPLIDLKHAIRWIREHGGEYGANSDFLVVTGGSAGGHLSSLVALTANDPEYQPGFEDVDTSVRGCVAFYGVYDFTNRHGTGREDMLPFLEKRVFKSLVADDRPRWDLASTISHVGPDAPPFFVLHGTNDSLVPVEQARTFVDELRKTSSNPVVYAELPLAQHAFDILPSVRAAHTARAVDRFLAVVRSEHGGPTPAEAVNSSA